ncbi:uncharacterized protein LOC117787499 [Drosophila innubila]|uniref:uncharacterized protein LOC117787499 n=1 Tax=Drosophila innubila TaxID=198719 RepID=UPI00148D1F07|nr:uncharacterized protein LOC117787499 [Drosophila innubila]
MGIADADKAATGETLDVKGQKARQRAFLKRRSSQFGNGHLQSSWNMCTDLQRQWSRRRLRRLLSTGRPTVKMPKQPSDLKQRSWSFFWYTLLPMLLVLCLSCCITMYQNGDVVSSFMQRYMNQYRAIVNNKLNYCDRTMPLHEIFDTIRADVLGQESALNQLEQAMGNQSSFQSIALVGSSGLGKSLTMRLLYDLYPWKENVRSIFWNDFELNSDKARYKSVSSMLRNLAHCGRNLFIIDNLTPCDKDYVSSINALLLSRSDIALGSNDVDLKQLTIIYVFNLNRLLDDELYDRQVEVLQQLPQTTVINYRNFDVQDLEKCVRHEAKVVDMYLDEKHVQEMLNSTDFRVSGCKTVRSKVLIYARPDPIDKEEHNQANDTRTKTN